MILKEIFDITSNFNYISCNHVCRDKNKTTDTLSKLDLRLDKGIFKVEELQGDHTYDYYHWPFIEYLNNSQAAI